MRHARKIFITLAATAVTASALCACSSSDPTNKSAGGNDSDTIVIGTANFPESEIIGQIWANKLEDAGFKVEVSSGIGSREVYMSALEKGEVDIVPEYTGNLAQFYKADLAKGADSNAVAEALGDVLPDGLAAADKAPAESKDAYNVTAQTAKEHDLKTLKDLGKLDAVKIAANPEIAERPFGPKGLTQVYGVPSDKISVNAISDGGGPLTIAALLGGQANVANIFTTSPHLDSNGNEVDLVTLQDPDNLIPSQNVVPVYRAGEVPEDAIAALNDVDAKLTTDDLIAMNLRNVGSEKAEPVTIAKDYLKK